MSQASHVSPFLLEERIPSPARQAASETTSDQSKSPSVRLDFSAEKLNSVVNYLSSHDPATPPPLPLDNLDNRPKAAFNPTVAKDLRLVGTFWSDMVEEEEGNPANVDA